jgi:hypothetical protein
MCHMYFNGSYERVNEMRAIDAQHYESEEEHVRAKDGKVEWTVDEPSKFAVDCRRRGAERRKRPCAL